MPKSQNQKLKLLYIMKVFLEKTDDEHGITLSDIETALESYGISAERKSIYSDIEMLRLYGLDIEMKRSPSVCYYIANRQFELPELKLLVDAVQSSKFITAKKSTQLIKKIESLASMYQAGKLQRQVYVQGRIKTMNESIYYSVDYIHTALSENRKIAFRYFEWSEKKEKRLRHNGKEYQVSPFSLTWNDENYYMIAYDNESQILKHYRVDKMLDIHLLDEKREGKEVFEQFDIALYSDKVFGMNGGKEERVTLRCSNSLAGVIIDRFGKEPLFHTYDADHFEVSVSVIISIHFFTWIMNFGKNMKIISPEYLIEDFKTVAKNALEVYQS